MDNFTFYSPTKFVFGKNTEQQAGALVKEFGGSKVLLHFGGKSAEKSGLLGRVRESLKGAGVDFVELGGVHPNPLDDLVYEGIDLCKREGVDFILAVGGGSVIDSSKAIAMGVCYDGDFWDFYSYTAQPKAALPVGTILTIAAAGSEGSPDTVITKKDGMVKRGFGNDMLRPKFSILNPALTQTLPAYQTACGATDIMAHVCERYFTNTQSVETTDRLCEAELMAMIHETPKVIANPDDYEARANIMWAGMLAHNDLCGCGRSAVPTARAGGWESHAIEHELSAHYPQVAHGAGLAVILPAWMRYVWRANPEPFLAFAADVFGIEPVDEDLAPRDEAVADAVEAAIDELQAFFVSMGMPKSLGEFGVSPDCIDSLLETLEKSKGAEFGGFRKLTMEDARAIYASAF